ncbi:hypothetical protein Psed_6996 (plasmid) [Pseudonocardia dioxanivorans CB1190]|uniref:Lipoprotein n=1 Tax=Pseudonocardia dioxanivorans (strain ATCC 55486 / DSM 44775 / JCM 13855 / CB1190) TaxID=675635 RepID=F2L780_PSEUX|nr:hypothetical protein [Pseudonocardia dioxanivorans]AEA29053.1 hypothetical protein Psed_6996 [Pseudonocardia dioxanivorans CB1190]
MRRALIITIAAIAAATLAACSSSPNAPAANPGGPLSTTQPAAAATPSAPPAATTQTKSGQGTDVVTLDTSVEVGILKFDCSKCTGTVEVKTDAEYDPNIVFYGHKAPYVGTSWLGMRGDTVTRIQVNTKGPWTVTVGGLDLIRVVDGKSPIAGKGDEVLRLTTPAGAAAITNKGGQYSNFTVWVMTDGTSSPELAVNEVGGSYEGTVMFPVAGPDKIQLVQVKSDGNWTITPK